MKIRLHAALVVVLMGACTTSATFTCDDLICPAGTTCMTELGACFSDGDIAACSGVADGAECSTSTLADGACASGVCFALGCGDQVRGGAEDCDGTDLGGATCLSLGFYDDTPLGCKMDCTYDTSQCTGFCGDGVANGVEVCDGDQLTVSDCTGLGYYTPGVLGCSEICTFDESNCSDFCGDGIVNGSEACDQSLPLDFCSDLGFDMGSTACSGLCGIDFSACRRIGFSLIGPKPGGDWPDNLFVVDDVMFSTRWWSGGLYMYKDGGWTPHVHPAGVPVDLWGLSSDNIYSVGGAVHRYDGSSWSLELDVNLSGIHGLADDDIWAVGWPSDGNDPPSYPAQIWHYDGNSWSETNDSGLNPRLVDVFAIAADDVYAVGGSRILHYDGANWSNVNTTGVVGFTRVWASGSDDVYAMSGTTVVHYDGNTWTDIGPNLSGFFDLAGIRKDRILILQAGEWESSIPYLYDGEGWTAVASPTATLDFASGPLGVIAGSDQGVVKFEDRAWSRAVVTGTLSAVWVKDRHTVVGIVGSNSVSRFTTAWSVPEQVDPSADLVAIWGTAEDNIYAVGDRVYQYTGSWAPVVTGYPGGGEGVWGSGPDDVYVVGGERVLHWNGVAWSETTRAGRDFRSVYGTGPGNVYAASADGIVEHFNGSAWSPLPPSGAADLKDIYATGTEAFAVGVTNKVFRWDGSTWQQMPYPGGSGLLRISGTSSTDLVAAGPYSGLLHYDGVRWSPIRGTENEIIYDVGATAGTLLMVGRDVGRLLVR